MKVKVVNTSQHKLPHYSTIASAGMDLRANLEKIAQGCGIVTTKTIRKKGELLSALPHIFDKDGPLFFVIKVRAEPLDFVLPPKDGAFLKDRFRSAVLRG